ncbi:MAG TPA: AAA family ATPase, partial [Stellaceae bacterium]|nr:AAA family ATPase [Stellaceae bacterium]
MDEPIRKAAASLEELCAALGAANTAIRTANQVIATRKAATEGADIRAAEAALHRLEAVRLRHTPLVAAACEAYQALMARKETAEAGRREARAKLEAHTKKVVTPYEGRINELLDSFNAGFRIAETTYSFPGGTATSTYRLVINRTRVDLGDANTGTAMPSFKNTLSAGDRTTLALAFFLAHLERDPSRAQRIVFFDDPFNSQDAFRRSQTVYEIKRAGQQCAQVFVLSHDAGFLRQVWEKAPTDQRVELHIADGRAQGSKIMPIDLNEACKGRAAAEI